MRSGPQSWQLLEPNDGDRPNILSTRSYAEAGPSLFSASLVGQRVRPLLRIYDFLDATDMLHRFVGEMTSSAGDVMDWVLKVAGAPWDVTGWHTSMASL